MNSWARSRRVFRWCRILLLSFVFLGALSLLYLNKVGLPGFLKSRIVAQLEKHGLNMEFSRLRLAGFREVRIENVSFGTSNDKQGPQLFIDAATLNLSWAELRNLRLGIDELQITHGRFIWPFLDSDGSRKALRLDDVVTELKFAPDDRWELVNFGANFFGAKIRLAGSIDNASTFRAWSSRSTNQTGNSWEPHFRSLMNAMQRIEYPSPPELTLKISGDAKDLSSFRARLRLVAPLAVTPWGKVRRLDLDSTIEPDLGVAGNVNASLLLQFEELKTSEGVLEDASAKSQTTYAYTNAPVLYSDWNISIRKAATASGFIDRLALELKTRQNTNEANTHLTTLSARAQGVSVWGASVSNPVLQATVATKQPNVEFFSGVSSLWSSNWITNVVLIKRGDYEVEAGKATVNGAHSETFRIKGAFAPTTNVVAVTDIASIVRAFVVDFESDVGGLSINELPVSAVKGQGHWAYPEIRLEKIGGEVYGEAFAGGAALNVSNSWLEASLSSHFDVRKVESDAAPNLREWLKVVTWTESPELNLLVRAHLLPMPSGTSQWGGYLRTNIQLTGDLKVNEFTVKEAAFRSANGRFSWSEGKLKIPELTLLFPEGKLNIEYSGDVLSDQFDFSLTSSVDPNVFRSLLTGGARETLDEFEFETPPSIIVEGGGDWKNPENLFLRGSLIATNFVFRDEEWKGCEAAFRYTNLFINLDHVNVTRDEGMIAIPSAGFDLRLMLGFVTNAFSTVDPVPVVKVMGPVVAAAVAPYHFGKPPRVRINGTIPTVDPSKADLYFQVSGGPFNYWRFNVPEISGDIHWQGDLLTISNVQASFYNGHLDWEGGFHFKPDDSADYHFKAAVQGADLRLTIADLVRSTNQLQGTFKGNLVITSANSDDWKSWQGFGDAHLEHGFLWNVPIFGVFSPLLNTIAPGLGNNPAGAASGTFTIDKSVIYTRDLEVKSPALRLRYIGQVDFDGNLNAHMRAEFLRDAWVIGKVFSIAFWPIAKALEYKVTGTLEEPKSKPLYLPKIMLFPFHPVQTLKEAFSRRPNEGSETNAVQNETIPK